MYVPVNFLEGDLGHLRLVNSYNDIDNKRHQMVPHRDVICQYYLINRYVNYKNMKSF